MEDSYNIHFLIDARVTQSLVNSFYTNKQMWGSICQAFFSYCLYSSYLSHIMRKPIFFFHMRTTKVQISLHSLINNFAVHFLDSIIPLLAKSEMIRLIYSSDGGCSMRSWKSSTCRLCLMPRHRKMSLSRIFLSLVIRYSRFYLP